MTQTSRAPGEVIAARYRLERRLAEGGIGEVWLAKHLHLRQDVAIKFLRQELISDPAAAADILARFRLESQVSAMLGRKTAHVVNVYDAGDSELGPFLAMEFVPGRSLGDELDLHGPLSPERLAIVLDQAADALGIAHASGIVHRDIKPANVMVSDEPDGSVLVKIADFGIAKTTILELPLDRPKDTTAMTMVGTPDFMSPEQLQGNAAHPAMDIWALGVTCYELLTGVLPFEGTSQVDMMIRIMNNRFDPPSSRRSSLPAALDAWFSRALAKEPADRFGSVREMSEAYRAAIDLPSEPLRAVARSIPSVPPSLSASEIAISNARLSTAPTLRVAAPVPQALTDAEMSTLPAATPAEPARQGGLRRTIVACVAVVVLLAGGSLIVAAARDSAPEAGLTAATSQPTGAAETNARSVGADPIGASPTGAPPSSAPPDVGVAASRPDVMPEPPASTQPADPRAPSAPKPRAKGADTASSPAPAAPTPSVTASAPPTQATTPKRVNPSTVF